jgi:hypothetical protein
MRYTFILVSCLALWVQQAFASTDGQCECQNNLDYTWGVLAYYGLPTTTTLGQVLEGKYKATGGKVFAAEVDYRLADTNLFRRFFGPLVHQIELAGNIAYISGGDNQHPVYEIDPFVMFRWNKFLWQNYLLTSFGIGEGISYATRIPAEEARDAVEQGNNTKHLINFLVLEATVALPKLPQWQLVTRLHHRSGAFGTYGAGNSGSNALSLGIRYSFF